MSTCIQSGERKHWISNQRLNSLLAFALQISELRDTSEQEQSWVEKLRRFHDEHYPGIDFDLDEHFLGIGEKKFWARIYHDVARAIFLRQIGDHQHTFWQSSAIGDAYIIARMLTEAVCQIEMGWHPETADKREADTFINAE